jgi:hypothetical protein
MQSLSPDYNGFVQNGQCENQIVVTQTGRPGGIGSIAPEVYFGRSRRPLADKIKTEAGLPFLYVIFFFLQPA